MNNDKLKIALLASTACLIWGSAFAFAKIGFQYMPPILLSGYRFVLAGFLLLPILLIQRYKWSELKGQLPFIFGFGVVQTFFQYGLFYYGLNLVSASVSAIIIGAGPLFVAVMAHFSLADDKIDRRKMFAILLGLSGVTFISINGISTQPHTQLFYFGVIALILSNIIGSASNILVVKHKRKLSPVALTALANFLGGIMLLLFSFVVEDYTYTALPTEFYLALLWLAFIPASAFSIWYYVLKLPSVKVSELNIWKFLTPVFGAILSWMILPDEYPNTITVVGIVIISLSVIILQLPRKSKK